MLDVAHPHPLHVRPAYREKRFSSLRGVKLMKLSLNLPAKAGFDSPAANG